MGVLYAHKRLSDNRVFYIGIGRNKKRAYSKTSRNKHWHSVVNKHGYSVAILIDGADYNELLKLEVIYISLFGRKDLRKGELVNKTDGGDSTLGMIHSDETKNKISKIRKENPVRSMKGKKHSEETKKIISEKAKGRIHSEEFKKKASERMIGNKLQSKKVYCGYLNREFESARACAKTLGIKEVTLNAQINGRNKNKYGVKYI
jgi:group I intron endonuclease